MISKDYILVVTVILTLTIYCTSAESNGLTDVSNLRIVCYYASWSAARTGVGKFTPENINPYLCTHLMYAFGSITSDIMFKPSDETVDIEQGGYAKFNGLKAHNKELKTFLALGGWREGKVRFASIAANSTKRSEFIKNSIEFLRKHNFDGLNFDWQFPYRKDRNSYSALIQELREGYERESKDTSRPRLLLTVTLPTSKDHITRGYNVPEITKYVDWMNVLTYDYHIGLEPVVNHHSQLYGLDENSDNAAENVELNANFTINTYLDSGAERDKLVLGIPTYGRAFTLEDSSLTDIGSPAIDSGLEGPQTNEKGFLAYYEICTKIKDDGWIVKQPYPNAMGSYAYKGNQWVGYDDEDIVRKKSQYVAENKFGGIYFWLIEYDDFRGSCNGKKFPLIEAAKEALITASGYRGNANQFTNDIAILILNELFMLSVAVQPVCIEPNAQHKDLNILLDSNSIGIVTGWGFIKPGGLLAEVLKVLSIPYVPFDKCFLEVPTVFRKYITFDKICGGYLNNGDAGGGFVFKNVVKDRYYIKAVASVSPVTEKTMNAIWINMPCIPQCLIILRLWNL